MEESDALPEGEEEPHNRYHDTVGVLAIDARGQMAGACSTSGLPFKVPGRVGDSPIIGHGLYVDPRRGAAVATGTGELIMGVCGSFLAVELMGRGASPATPPAKCSNASSTATNSAGKTRWRSSRASVGPVEFRLVAAGLSYGGAHRHPRRIGPARVRPAAVRRTV